jgi:type II secretory pathway component PulF
VPTFEYEVLGPTGEISRGASAAPDELALEGALRALGLYLIRAEPQEEEEEETRAARPASARPRPEKLWYERKVSRKELLALTEYLFGSAQAGLPILTTLGDLELRMESPVMRRVAGEMRRAMEEEGKTLSGAMAEHPTVFDRLYVATVEAGEATGQMDFALGQLVEHLEWQREITLQLRQATLYPLFVLCAMLLLVGLLVAVVYPRLMPVFRGFHVQLPLPTRIVLAMGAFLTAHAVHLALGAVAVGGALRLVARSERGRLLLDTLRLRLPIFGALQHQIEMARVVTYMSLFYRAGVDLLRGLDLLEQMVDNRRIAAGVRDARLAIAGGDGIAHAFEEVGLFSPIVLRSFALGEATGKLDDSLQRAKVYYGREVPAAVRRMLSALQPLLIVLLGGGLAVVALSIFLPVLQIYQSIGK